MNMTHENIYRLAGACGLVSIALFCAEIPLYLARGPLPTDAASSLSAYATRNAGNMLIIVGFDLLICALLLTFLAGFRHLIREKQPSSVWLATQVFGAGVAYATITLFNDLLQGAIAFNALAGDPDASLIRAFLASRYPVFGAMGLIFSAVLLSAASYVSHASRALPALTTWLGYLAAILCLALVPFVMVGGPNLAALLNTPQRGTNSVIGAVPLALWMIAVGIAMFRVHSPKVETH
jgi:hypothetical protein